MAAEAYCILWIGAQRGGRRPAGSLRSSSISCSMRRPALAAALPAALAHHGVDLLNLVVNHGLEVLAVVLRGVDEIDWRSIPAAVVQNRRHMAADKIPKLGIRLRARSTPLEIFPNFFRHNL